MKYDRIFLVFMPAKVKVLKSESITYTWEQLHHVSMVYACPVVYQPVDGIEDLAVGWSGVAPDDFVLVHMNRLEKSPEYKRSIPIIKEFLSNRKTTYINER